ncbi:putative dienelactone hydrolase, alpha/Beta hydrolase [Helianthus annuus]|uniref:Dienelactone hydrolase, alpha/Beta hydrolase n=1 Tax=Helianthus annuus TaxID=4232 RepID=A0A9K3I022_HELAN|nr:putative dienelactone hydrolase, alpha/Beta hydrolase [Helianthus annuus]
MRYHLSVKRPFPVASLLYIFIQLVDPLQLADKVAAAGYYVLVPDFLFGDYWTPETQLDDWTKKHAPEQTVEFAKPVVQALKEKGISKLGSAGFCWGAKAVADLAKEAEIQVAALLHPNFVTLDDIKGMFCSTTLIIRGEGVVT